MTGAAPTTDHAWRPARFMVIAAHPDDAEFGPAGTAARWIDAGSQGWLVCCTSGDQGGEDPDADPLVLAAQREAEQRAAAAIIGYAGVTFLHGPDHTVGMALKRLFDIVVARRKTALAHPVLRSLNETGDLLFPVP